VYSCPISFPLCMRFFLMIRYYQFVCLTIFKATNIINHALTVQTGGIKEEEEEELITTSQQPQIACDSLHVTNWSSAFRVFITVLHWQPCTSWLLAQSYVNTLSPKGGIWHHDTQIREAFHIFFCFWLSCSACFWRYYCCINIVVLIWFVLRARFS